MIGYGIVASGYVFVHDVRDLEFVFFFFLMLGHPPKSTLFPSPPLFRSRVRRRQIHRGRIGDGEIDVRRPPRRQRAGERIFTLGEIDPHAEGLTLPAARSRWSSVAARSEEHTSELQSPCNLVCRLLLEKK